MSDSKEINTKIKGDNNTVNTGPHIYKSNSEVKMPYEDFQRRIELERKDAIEEHTKASDAEKVKLEQKIAELDRRLADVPKAFQEFKERIARLESILEREGNEIGNKKLVEARDALEKGDFSKADDLFAEIEAREELAVKRSARAAFARGEIAEQEVRWYDAAEHYTRAAQLDPCYDNLIMAVRLSTDIGNYDSALSLGEEAKKAAIKDHGQESRQHATSLNNLASVYHSKKQYKKAKILYKESLKLRQDTLEKKHPDIANSLSNLGVVYQNQAQYTKAKHFFKRALNINKETLGTKHPSTAEVLNNLGGSYRALGEFKKAKSLLKQALNIQEKFFGINHPRTANTLNNLGGIYYEQKKDKQALLMFQQALEIFEATLGPNHPDTKLLKSNYEETKKNHS